MKVEEIAPGAGIDTIINNLKLRPYPLPDVSKFEKRLDVLGHDVFNTAKREDKTIYPDPVKDAAGNITSKGEGKTEKVNRIGFALQKLVIKRAVSFLFGNRVVLDYNAETDEEKALIECLEEMLEDNKEEFLNKQIARKIFSFTEAAEYWFPVQGEESHEEYGFSTKFKLRCKIFSPDKGDKLYPYFDEHENLVAFSREFKIKKPNLETIYFETYTDEELVRWKQSSLSITGGWIEDHREPIAIKKIPIVYGRQDEMETEDIESIINRLEKMFSNLGDTNDYHSAPKIFVNGRILSFGSKGSSNTVIQGEKDAKAEYLSWDHAPESFLVEANNLIKMAYTITQTPDISFDSVKGIGALSGIALKLMFLDAHLKVKDKEEIFIPYLQRRYKIMRAYATEMKNGFKTVAKMKIKPVIEPYMIADELMQAQVLQTANGGKPFMSQLESVKAYGGNQEDYDKIKEEKKEDSLVNTFETTY
ncbi:phage portal protein [Pedobacter sp. Leaf132]|uniref:phage portal protein n=1 Tax=Pedobacter sp. Leaf132 TaxID=2876557 RepID=UPI001E3AC490|nr:phage portal protein [Pedobacter sp. Leaf132]